MIMGDGAAGGSHRVGLRERHGHERERHDSCDESKGVRVRREADACPMVPEAFGGAGFGATFSGTGLDVPAGLAAPPSGTGLETVCCFGCGSSLGTGGLGAWPSAWPAKEIAVASNKKRIGFIVSISRYLEKMAASMVSAITLAPAALG